MQATSMRAANLFISLPHNPLLRALVLVAGTILLIGLLAMSLLVGAAVLIVAALAVLVRRWLKGRGRKPADPTVIEGEFRVVPPRPRASLPNSE